eukprot:Trichotokara_eunicae@DN5195_c0_g1_i4.p1
MASFESDDDSDDEVRLLAEKYYGKPEVDKEKEKKIAQPKLEVNNEKAVRVALPQFEEVISNTQTVLLDRAREIETNKLKSADTVGQTVTREAVIVKPEGPEEQKEEREDDPDEIKKAKPTALTAHDILWEPIEAKEVVDLAPDSDQKGKKRNFVKDKEKQKRVKGQSSHDSWKSEEWMRMRQQFD